MFVKLTLHFTSIFANDFARRVSSQLDSCELYYWTLNRRACGVTVVDVGISAWFPLTPSKISSLRISAIHPVLLLHDALHVRGCFYRFSQVLQSQSSRPRDYQYF